MYLRQSRDALQTGLAVERQRQDCEKLAAERGWDVIRVLIDNDLSASSGVRRPGYEELLRLVDERSIDVIVVWHIDRLMRRLSDLENVIQRCERAQVRVATVSGDLDLSTDAGRLVGRILSSVAQGEVERKSARQRRAAQQAAESGRPPARRAFGFTNGGHDPVEAAALREVYRLVLAGTSLVAATRWLNDRGHRTTMGNPWDRSSVRSMLLNPRNAGLRAYHRAVVGPGAWEPIVDESIWRAVVELLTDLSRTPRHSGTRWLGSGFYRCHCGSAVRVNYSHAGRRVYQCSTARHLSRLAAPIDDLVGSVVVARLRHPDVMALLCEEAPDVEPLRAEAAALRLRLDQLATDYAAELLTGRQVRVASELLGGKLEAAEKRLADAGRASRLGPVVTSPDPGQAWLDSDLSVQRLIVDIMATITVLPGERGRAAFDPRSVRIKWRQLCPVSVDALPRNRAVRASTAQ